jgi:hypothetical protein
VRSRRWLCASPLAETASSSRPTTASKSKPGRSARKIEIAVGVATHGEGVEPLELHGAIDALQVSEGFVAAGAGFAKV